MVAGCLHAAATAAWRRLARVGFARPDQARKPGHIVCTIDVERVEVDPCPPGHLKAPCRGNGTGPIGRHDSVGAPGSVPTNR